MSLKSSMLCNLDRTDSIVTGEPNCDLTPAQKANALANLGLSATQSDSTKIVDGLCEISANGTVKYPGTITYTGSVHPTVTIVSGSPAPYWDGSVIRLAPAGAMNTTVNGLSADGWKYYATSTEPVDGTLEFYLLQDSTPGTVRFTLTGVAMTQSSDTVALSSSTVPLPAIPATAGTYLLAVTTDGAGSAAYSWTAASV